jgi:hypothetical protein
VDKKGEKAGTPRALAGGLRPPAPPATVENGQDSRQSINVGYTWK